MIVTVIGWLLLSTPAALLTARMIATPRYDSGRVAGPGRVSPHTAPARHVRLHPSAYDQDTTA